MLQKRGEFGKDWDEFLPYACFAYRDAVQCYRVQSVPVAIWERCTRSSLPVKKLTNWRDHRKSLGGRLHGENEEPPWKTAKENDEEAKRKSKNYQDKKACRRIFNCGDQVLVFEPGEDKFSPLWHGPYTVEERVNDLTYRIATPERRKQTSTRSRSGSPLSRL